MVYAKACRNSMYPDFQANGGYVDYQRLKAILHRMKEDAHSPNRATEKELYDALVDECQRIYTWSVEKVKELTKVATDAVAEKSQPVSVVKASADAILHETLRFVECRNLNTDTINRIVLRHHRYTALSPSNKWLSISEGRDPQSISIDEVFYLVSVLFERFREGESASGPNRSQGMDGSASQVFDRRSVKYWVHRQDLPFVVGRIIQHLPLSTISDTYSEAKESNIQYRLGQQISSVYYDTEQFLCYHRRLERLEGSSLLRVRWYGDHRESDINKIKDEQDCFVELKVHHEAWSGERSTKRRFAVKSKDVNNFFEGNLNLDPAVEKLRKKGTSDKDIEKFKGLAYEVLGKFEAYSMKPVLRTQYVRSAFQRGTDASVRVSIDENLRMSAEDFGMGRNWRYEGIDELAHIDFPYSVVEVKLMCSENERIAPWIEELMQCRFMEAVPKFSKFGHGISALYGHTPRVHMVPYWLHQTGVDIRAVTKDEHNKWDPTAGLAVGWFQRATDRAIFGTKEPQDPSIGAAEAPFLSRDAFHREDYQRLARGLTPGVYEGSLIPVGTDYDLNRRHRCYMEKRVYNYGTGNIESICGAIPTVSAARIGDGSIPWQIRKRVQVPQRFDPKTLLTGERYFLKWVVNGTKLGIGALLVIRFGGHGIQLSPHAARRIGFVEWWWRHQMHVWLGLVMMGIALCTMLYAMLVFRSRSRRVFGRRKVRYDDVRGPTMLTVGTIACFLAIAANHVIWRYGPMLSGGDDAI